PFYDSILERPQPSFMLLPLKFLAVAESAGGIHQCHIDFLPIMMVAMEAVAVTDDTVDRTPNRSGEPTFPQRWGSICATPCMAVLMALIARRAQEHGPSILDLVMWF